MPTSHASLRVSEGEANPAFAALAALAALAVDSLAAVWRDASYLAVATAGGLPGLGLTCEKLRVVALCVASATALLNELERVARQYEPASTERKRQLVEALDVASLARSKDVLRLHETLCFFRAYPDDFALLSEVVNVLERWHRRGDVRQHRAALRDSGVAGTAIRFPFHWVTAQWLARRFPNRLHIDWPAASEGERERLRQVLPLLVPEAEWPDFDLGLTEEQWLGRMKGPDETDATFVVRRFAALPAEPRLRESLFHDLTLPMRLDSGPGTPSRTEAWHSTSRIVFQTAAPSRQRPALRSALRRAPKSVRKLGKRDAVRIIDLAREAMITRQRDLDGIMYASPEDVRLVDTGDGLSLACFGLLPEHRALVETLYVYLLLRNGVPVGYFQSALLFGSAELNYHIFPTFRGGDTAEMYARSLAATHHLFGVDAFSVDGYQLGLGNPDALSAGAFWFYRKLGFAPEDSDRRRLLAREEQRMAASPSHRSTPKTLKALAQGHVHFYLGRPRNDVAGKIALGRFSLAVTDVLAKRFGSERERGLDQCARELSVLTGIKLAKLSKSECGAWRSWAPLALALPGVERWSTGERRSLGDLVRAKGGRSEQEFAERLAKHRKLRAALLRLSRSK